MSTHISSPGRLTRWALWATLAALALPNPAGAQVLRQDLWVANGTVNALVATDTGIYLGGSFSQVGPEMGNAVAIDAGTGAAIQPYPEVDGTVTAIAPDGNGGWYLGGNFDAVLGQPRHDLAQIDASGALTAWAPEPNGMVLALAVSGKTVYVGGYFTTLSNEFRGHIGAIDSTGAPTAWEPDADGAVTCLALDGTIVYAGGPFSMIGGQNRAGLAAIDGSGAATAWNPGQDGLVNTLAVNLGTVYVGGTFAHVGGAPRSNLAAVDTNGIPTGWAPTSDGAVSSISVTQGVVVGSTTVYVGGAFSAINGTSRPYLASIDNNGALTSWSPSPNGTVEAVVARLSLHTFSVYAGGHFTSIGGQPRNHIALLNSSGLATAWDPNAENSVRAIAVGNGVVEAGGDFQFIGGLARKNLAEFSSSSGDATGWNPGADATVRALALRGNTMYVGGDFQALGGQPASRLGAITADTGTALTPGQFFSATDGSVDCLTVSGSTIYVGGEFTHVQSARSPGIFARNYAAAVDTTGFITDWSPDCNGYVRAIAVRTLPTYPFSPFFYLGGRFTSVGVSPRLHIAEIDGTGNVTSWIADADHTGAPEVSTVNAILAFSLFPSGASIYAGGDFTVFDGQPRNYAGAANGAGAPLSWNPGPNTAVRSFAPGNGVIYMGGDFGYVSNQEHDALVAVDGGSGAPLPWNASLRGATVNAIALGQGTVYAGGSIVSVQGLPRVGIVGLTDATTGVRDATPGAGAVALRAVPNPSHGGLSIRFVLPSAGRLDARVFDISGRVVRSLGPVMLAAGAQQLDWDGKNDEGVNVTPGIYYVRADGPGMHLSGKVVRVP